MTRIGTRLEQLAARVPAPQPIRERDLRRLTAGQRARLELLNERFVSVGMTGLTDAEVDEVAGMLAILEDSTP